MANPWIIVALESVLGHGPASEVIPGSQHFLPYALFSRSTTVHRAEAHSHLGHWRHKGVLRYWIWKVFCSPIVPVARGAERQVCLVCRCSHMLRSFVYNMISKKRLPQSTYPNLVQFDSLMSIWSLKYKWWVILLILQKEDLRNTLVCGAAGTSYLTLFEPQ